MSAARHLLSRLASRWQLYCLRQRAAQLDQAIALIEQQAAADAHDLGALRRQRQVVRARLSAADRACIAVQRGLHAVPYPAEPQGYPGQFPRGRE